MTAKQKANQARFKKVQAEAKKLKAKNKKLSHVEAVKQAWAIMLHKKPGSKKIAGIKHKKSKTKKPSEQSILNKIHKVKKDVDRLDEAQHKHMTIGAIKSAGLIHLKHKYGILSAKKLLEKTKRGKAKITKEMRHVATSIKKIHSI
jgi:hypothetical protein